MTVSENIWLGKKWDRDAEYIGRGSPLGNPYKITSTRTRAEACALYDTWLRNKISSADPAVIAELNRLLDKLEERGSLILGCYCVPLQCHGESIRHHLLTMIKARRASTPLPRVPSG
jgi:hypothetical protein